MKQKIEVNPFYNENGNLNREQSICLTIDEYVPEKKHKPADRKIKELREQKKLLLENKKEFYPIDCIEFDICRILKEKKRGKGRIKQFDKAIELIKKMQQDKQILDFSRKFLNDILKDKFKERTRNRLINKILKKAKVKRERIIEKKYLRDIRHFEVKLKGEKTTSKTSSIERKWKTSEKIEIFYSFLE